MQKESIAAYILVLMQPSRQEVDRFSADDFFRNRFDRFNFGTEVDAAFFFLVGLLFLAFLSCADSMSLAMSLNTTLLIAK